MKKLFQKIIGPISRIGLIGLIFLSSACGGAGGESPAADIPAPVSHVTASSPDSTGAVRVTANAGFSDGGTAVTITNPSVVTDLWLDWLIRSAHAHATHEITSETDGSFQEEIEGAVGDVLTVTFTRDGEEQSEDLTVPPNVPPLPTTSDIQDVSIDPLTGTALVVANDGVDGFVHLIDLADMTYTSTITLPGASGAVRIATDQTTGDSIVLDAENSTATRVTLGGGGSVVGATDILPSSDLAAGPAGDYVLIAHTDSTPALSFFDISAAAATATGDSEAEGGTDQDSALLVSTDFDLVDDMAAVVSLMPDSTFLLTTHEIDETVPSISQDGAFPLDITTPGGLFVFSAGTEAILTDSADDSVVRVVLADGTSVRITVGDDPRGVVVDEGELVAFVVNNGEHNVTLISLADDSISGAEEAGLSPTEAAVSGSTVVVVNTGDETITILD